MRKRFSLPLLISVILVFGLGASSGQSPAKPSADTSSCIGISDGRGVVRLLWTAPEAFWAAGGWQIMDETGRVLKRVVPGDAAAMAEVTKAEAAVIESFAKGLPPFKTDQDREGFFFSVNINIFLRPAFARAAGFSAVIDGLPGGLRSYRIQGLSADGKAVGTPYQSPAVDASIPSLPPAAPAALKAESLPSGVALFWTDGGNPEDLGGVYYLLERKSDETGFVRMQNKPILLTEERSPETPAFLDAEASLEKMINYRIYASDAFGRVSPPAEISIYHLDHAALRPPQDLTVLDEKGDNILTWKALEKAGSGKIMVLRAQTPVGPFLPVAPEGVPLQSTRYEDKDVRGGVRYYYQVYILGSKETEGPRSPVVSVVTKSFAPPAAPVEFKAEIERTRIRLSWSTAAGGPILAGYIIERLDKAGHWVRLNDDITSELTYNDYSGAEGPARWSYRVRSVARDNQESPPSAVVEVVVPDRTVPPSPTIDSIDGSGGKTVLRFRPGLPEEKSAQFVVLRSGEPRDVGVVLGRPLPASAREYMDPFVESGTDYWYRVVAIGTNGNRSEPSDAVLVRVGPPPIPEPPAPKAELVLKPFPLVRLSVPLVPQGLELVLDRKLESETDWLRLSSTARGGEIVDGNPPLSGRIQYRIIFRTSSGVYGSPSAVVEVQR